MITTTTLEDVWGEGVGGGGKWTLLGTLHNGAC